MAFINIPSSPPRWRRGAALVVVLAFMVLLTGLVTAFFARALENRCLSDNSAGRLRAELLARGAVDQVIGDLKQEIEAGSRANGAADAFLRIPALPWSSVPCQSGTSGGAAWLPPNVVKRSAAGQPFFDATRVVLSAGSLLPVYPQAASHPPANRAAACSTLLPALNLRHLTLERWNMPLLIPELPGAAFTPQARGSLSLTFSGTTVNLPWAYDAPDWILMDRRGGNPGQWTSGMQWSRSGSASVIGRYAYMIYDEGGLLDANTAGFPSPVPPAQAGQKGSLALADLTRLPTGPDRLSRAGADKIIAWRNPATAVSGTAYLAALHNINTGFLAVGSNSGHADRAFVSRQHLIKFMTGGASGLDPANARHLLQYLGTFSRDLNQPSHAPAPDRLRILASPGTPPGYADYHGGNDGFGNDDAINPSFLSVRTAAAFMRNDGTLAQPGEPLVKKRFPLECLAWLTCRGESAGRNLDSPSSTGPDADIYALIHEFGVSTGFLKLGTAAAIRKVFGLVWNPSIQGWDYNPEPGAPLSDPPPAGAIRCLGELATAASPREPNFVELLKAGIVAGSLGKSSGPLAGTAENNGVRFLHEDATSIDIQVLQIAANIIDQADPDGYPTCLRFNQGRTGGADHLCEIHGVENLPYLYRTRNFAIPVKAPSPLPPYPKPAKESDFESGAGAMLLAPEVWNPHDQNGRPGTPRPTRFRFVFDDTTPWRVQNAQPESNTIWARQYQDATVYDHSSQPGFTNEPGTVLNASTTSLDFDDPEGKLYREPTILRTPGVPAGSNLASGSAHMLRMLNSAGKLAGLAPDGALADIQAADASGAPQKFTGVYLGCFPLARISGGSAIQQDGDGTLWNHVAHNVSRMTFRLQFLDQDGMARTFDTKFWSDPQNKNNTANFQFSGMTASAKANDAALRLAINGSRAGLDLFAQATGCADPRTSRFGMQWNAGDPGPCIYNPDGTAATYKTLPVRQNVTATDRFNARAGRSVSSDGFSSAMGFSFSKWGSLGLISQNNPAASAASPGLPGYSAADLPPTGTLAFYSDPDGVVRRAMGAYTLPGNATVPSDTSSVVGLPLATATRDWKTGSPSPTAQSQSRPLILNRPFQNVAELGCVFSNTPWKNLDFFTPESGNTALLDLFCIHDPNPTSALIAGKINLNTRQTPVIEAILSGATRDEISSLPSPPSYALSPLSAAEAAELASALVARTTGSSGPLVEIGDLVGRRLPTGIFDGFSGDLGCILGNSGSAAGIVQRFRESAIRPLAGAGTTRVWNLMIDLVAQSGRYPSNPDGDLAKFNVEGETRCWVHVSIDRFTGTVVDLQIEAVNE